ncbi:MAG TPA: glycoside hydrolase family 38 C-terminal domain-containing protein [Pseudonocardia sp.]|uniref:alpha-mannosidase n=1 Tax=Pseudonocardia sp. TaxID=60912 RepID=UPI002B4AB407|nr:glycoside hydrolase family 38 C-terminal domain-containing protein [Pseudonocardia sp.]HLU55819.1 glycoside hydrolase family 38 C-terminal domain-containing protein [Pseudonocardia sp.]
MHDDSKLVRQRITRFVRERLVPAVYRERVPTEVTAWAAPGEPVPFAEAVRQEYSPFTIGSPWGRPWGTVWFHLTGAVPAGWTDPGTRPELVVDLGFAGVQPGFQSEGLAYAPDGTVIAGVEPRNAHVPLRGGPGSPVDVYVEAASNPGVAGDWAYTPTRMGDPATAGDDPLYRLVAADVALLDVTVWELVQDFWTLTGLVDELPADQPRRAEVLRALERAVDAVDPDDVAGTAALGRAELADVLASPAHPSAHRVHAVGHAHIDSAWLWPVRETVRKVARTFANVLDLMETDEEFVFAASSAQQYAWLAEHQPELFERVKRRVAEGRFVPVGGMWVESDTNMPGSEALARQFVAGKRFFIERLGVEPLEVWLPDSFGYTAALPQIIKAAGSRWFLTQKISWNETNVMPHHTFRWEGIDGTQVFTHFPPVDTYNSELSQHELHRAQRQYAEKGRANTSLVPFGWGDGGGGPTREMLAAAARTKSLEGSPTVRMSSPAEFFAAAEAEYPRPPVWSGELYLEFHRGTYTSQARTKRGNRRSEHLLREAELWAATAAVRAGLPYPADVLERCWHTVLLQQFHDILPGTSIAWVHQEAERNYARVAEELEGVIARSLAALAGEADGAIAVNAGPYPVDGVPALGGGPVAAPAGGVHVADEAGGTVLDNGVVRAVIDARGLLTSVVDLAADREVVAPGSAANLLQLHRDTPTQWDAWDIDEHYRRHGRDLTDVAELTVVERGPQRAAARVVRKAGASTITQVVSLAAGSASIEIDTHVDWHERQKLLKLAFPVDVHADRATSEIQFGHLHRPIHTNTSWDAARFETVAHRWVHVGEPGYGVAVANDSTYGHDVTRSTRPDGGTTTVVRLSLLRAPLFPDPTADQGEHRMRVSLRVGATIADAVAEGYRLNLPLRTVRGGPIAPLVSVDSPAVVVEAVKLAEDGSGDVVVRLYEAFGGRATARVTADFPHHGVVETDLLERPLAEPVALSGVTPSGDGVLRLRPFRIVTLRYRRSAR